MHNRVVFFAVFRTSIISSTYRCSNSQRSTSMLGSVMESSSDRAMNYASCWMSMEG